GCPCGRPPAGLDRPAAEPPKGWGEESSRPHSRIGGTIDTEKVPPFGRRYLTNCASSEMRTIRPAYVVGHGHGRHRAATRRPREYLVDGTVSPAVPLTVTPRQRARQDW